MHLFVADGFNIEMERPYQKTQTKAFELLTKNRIIDLTAMENGTLPIIHRKVDFEGGGLIHLERDYSRISLPTKKFFDYLKEDHIDGIADKVDTKKKEQRERYTRYIKCLVQSENIFEDTNQHTTLNTQHNEENMEVHKHPHHVTHKKKWTEYLLEFFMLFLAVFLGFVAENVRESISEKHRAKELTYSLINDLKKDTSKLNYLIAFQEGNQKRCDSSGKPVR